MLLGRLDIVLAMARFVLLLCVHRLWHRRTQRDEHLLLLLSLLLLCAGAALSAQLLFGFAFLAFSVTATWAMALTHVRFEIEAGRGPQGTAALLQSRRIATPALLGGLAALSMLGLVGSAVIFFAFPRVNIGGLRRASLRSPVAGLGDGVKHVASMLNVTRLWNAVCSAAGMHRALALATDYAGRREAFGATLAAQPLHADTLAALEAEREGAFLLAFRAAELLGLSEAGEATPADLRALRAVTPLAKLTTGKQAVAVASETLECFGGAGYVEDTGLPRLLRDAQVLPIWEGTTNVLALDLLRALGAESGLAALAAEIRRPALAARDPALRPPAEAALRALEHALGWLDRMASTPAPLQAGARRLALTLGRALEVALLCEHAQAARDAGWGGRAAASARRLARQGIDLVQDEVDELTSPAS